MEHLDLSRFEGCLLGLATGDALGTTTEFEITGEFEPIQDIVGGGPFLLKPGEWTDDTSMALCLAESILKDGFSLESQLNHYLEWFRNGKWSVKGFCFDIGGTTRKSLGYYARNHTIMDNSQDVYSLGNGSLMRLAAIPMFYAHSFELATKFAEESSRTTHSHIVCRKCSGYLGGLIVNALHGKPKEALFDGLENYFSDAQNDPYYPLLQGLQNKSYLRKTAEHFSTHFVNTGFVISCLEVALWGFMTTDNFKDGALKIVNLGGDADTTAAVYGQLAGAYYGISGIPSHWVEVLAMNAEMRSLAQQLHQKASNPQPSA